MNTMTKQEIFDYIAMHLLIQNAPARIGGQCHYRLVLSDRVLRCAVGCLIPPRRYSTRFEGLSLKLLRRVIEVTTGPLDREKMTLLLRLQSIHDGKAVADWPRALRKTAMEFDLDSTVIGTVLRQIQNA